MLRCVRQELPDHVELVVAGEELDLALAAGVGILRGDQRSEVLDDLGQALRRQRLTPQVVGRKAIGVRWIARAIVHPLVEGQEPGLLSLELGAEAHVPVVDGEVGKAATEREQKLARVAIALVLLDRVVHGLFRERVLQLEGRDRQPVQEQRQIQRVASLVVRVAELARRNPAVPAVK